MRGHPKSRLVRHLWAMLTGLLHCTWMLGLLALNQSRVQAEEPFSLPKDWEYYSLPSQSRDDALLKSHGCINCHGDVGNMHSSPAVYLGCTDCHGGDASGSTMEQAHVKPRFPNAWRSSANPIRSYSLLNHESADFIRFVNPGDLRVAHISCGQCHEREVLAVRKSMMTHGCMLWGAALYNNGAYPKKWARYGESYSMCGAPQRMFTVPPPTEKEIDQHGVLPYLDPLPRFEISQPGNLLRIFERGGRFRAETGIPERLEEAGRPRERLSNRGLGTENRTDPVFIGLQKTRLLDPTLNFLGTNDHPGDYRSSGCSACHVMYANDRSPVNSGSFWKYGHGGMAASEPDRWVKIIDPTIPKDEPGHPIQHRFVTAPPSSQCIVCHIHPGTTVMNSYLGFMWWDNETDGDLMYPAEPQELSAEEYAQALMSNPEESSLKGLWSDPEFLKRVSELNAYTRHTQFGDFHGHGWVFRAVFKKDRQGNLLDHRGRVIPEPSNDQLRAAMLPASAEERKWGKQRDNIPVHLLDIHIEKGMHCVDCHFNQDVHGDTKLYGEVRAAIEIACIDCHGTATESIIDHVRQQVEERQPRRMPTSGPAAPMGGTNLLSMRTPFGRPRFEIVRQPGSEPQLIQHSMVEEGLCWEVVQTKQSITPGNRHYNVKSHVAKTVQFNERGRLTWGGDPNLCPHQDNNMSCMACHSSWNPSCFGCHLPQKANRKVPNLHFDGDVSRNLVSYNFQTLRDDVFMLARDGNATRNRINPARSSCAIHVTSYNANRETIYIQQQTISADGMSGIAFSTNVPHTVRGGSDLKFETGEFAPGTSETKQCTDCHVSQNNDNNAIMTQLMMLGTGYTNFIGRYCWVGAGEHGLEAVIVTEDQEPQAVIGSSLHRLAFPDKYEEHLQRDRELEHSHEHPGKDIIETLTGRFDEPEVLDLQARGEFLYAACGESGLRVFDIAFIDNKAFSERITTAPVSPVGQRLFVRTEYATSVAAPTTVAPDPTRNKSPENHEQDVHPLYAYIYVTDRHEGLILVGAGTLLDGNPLNNFLERAVTFNPDGLLNGARSVTIVGTYAYVCCNAGLVIVSLDDPTKPYVVNVVGPEVLVHPHAVQVQFRYAFVCDEEGVKVFDVTRLDDPRHVTTVHIEEAHNIYLARTYAYVAAGPFGLMILDITNPEQTFIDQVYDAEGCMNDVHDVQLGITNVSEFAYVADGKNGLRIVQLTSPDTPGNDGFSPRPTPMLIATYKLPKDGHALAISRGIDRDRAVDEGGNQISVFGRVGARPLNRDEQQHLYLRPDGTLWRVSDNPFDLNVFDPPPTLLNAPEYRRLIRQPGQTRAPIHGPQPWAARPNMIRR